MTQKGWTQILLTKKGKQLLLERKKQYEEMIGKKVTWEFFLVTVSTLPNQVGELLQSMNIQEIVQDKMA